MFHGDLFHDEHIKHWKCCMFLSFLINCYLVYHSDREFSKTLLFIRVCLSYTLFSMCKSITENKTLREPSFPHTDEYFLPSPSPRVTDYFLKFASSTHATTPCFLRYDSFAALISLASCLTMNFRCDFNNLCVFSIMWLYERLTITAVHAGDEK